MTITQPATVENLWALPENGRWHELIQGELRTVSPSNSRHGDIALTIGALLRAFAHPRKLGRVLVEAGFILTRDPDTVVAPDVAMIRQSRIPPAGLPEYFFEGPPDLAVEIISPNDAMHQIEKKIQLYLRSGTKAVWLVNPQAQTLTVYDPTGLTHHLAASDQLTIEFLLPGFACRVADCFDH